MTDTFFGIDRSAHTVLRGNKHSLWRRFPRKMKKRMRPEDRVPPAKITKVVILGMVTNSVSTPNADIVMPLSEERVLALLDAGIDIEALGIGPLEAP